MGYPGQFEHEYQDAQTLASWGVDFWKYLLRGILMSTWGFLPAVFDRFGPFFPGFGAGFLKSRGQDGGNGERNWEKRGKMGDKWPKNGGKMG